MNYYMIVSLFLTAAFLVLAFMAVKVMQQRDDWRKIFGEMKAQWAVAEGYRAKNASLEETFGKLERQLAEKQTAFDMMEQLANRHREVRFQLGEERDVARDAYEALRAARNVTWTRPARRMAQGEVKRAFAVAPDAPLWIALHQQLDDWLQGLLDEVSRPPSEKLSEALRLHLAGGIEELREFQKSLLELHAAAQHVDADLEGDAPEKKGGAS